MSVLDGEGIVGGYLRNEGFRVVSRTPANKTTAWVRLTQLDATNETHTSETEHQIDYAFQLDCYAADNGYADQLAIDVREALVDMPKDPPNDAVVTRVTFQGHSRIPDTDGFEPARERVVLDCTVRMHG